MVLSLAISLRTMPVVKLMRVIFNFVTAVCLFSSLEVQPLIDCPVLNEMQQVELTKRDCNPLITGFTSCLLPEVTLEEGESGHAICKIPNDEAFAVVFIEYCPLSIECKRFTSFTGSLCHNSSNFFVRIPNPRTAEMFIIDVEESNNLTAISCHHTIQLAMMTASPQTAFIYVIPGLLATPKDLMYTVMDEFVNLTWSPPYTLPETDLEFRVTISIPDYSNNIFTFQPSLIFSYSTLNISRCHSSQQINFTIRGVNSIEELGEPAFISVVLPQKISCCEDAEMLIGKLSSPTNLTLTINSTNAIAEWTPPINFSTLVYYTIEVLYYPKGATVLMCNTNQTSHVFGLSDLNITDRCSTSYQFTVNVYGVNYAGKGDSSNTTLLVLPDYKCSTTVQATDEITESYHPPEDPKHDPFSNGMLTHIAGFTGAGVSLVTISVIVSAVIACCLLKRKKKKRTENSKLPMYQMEPNSCYVVTQIKKNEAYETRPHVYEEMDLSSGPAIVTSV